MEAAEWGDFVVENKEVLMDQMLGWIPLAKFTDIFPGTPYTVYLQKKRGSLNITFESVRLEFDRQRRMSGREIVPSANSRHAP